MPTCNVTLEESHINEEKLSIGITFHQLGLILCVVSSLYSSLVTFYLIIFHALHYSKPLEQKHIIRILFMIVVYGWVSFLSFLFYRYTIYFQVIRDCYEALAIAAFFTLLCTYLEPTVHEQKNYFRAITPKNWVLPINWFQRCSGGEHKGAFRKPTSGLTWFNIVWVGVYQYCGVLVVMTFVSLVAQVFGRYCDSSLNPAFAHIWTSLIDAVGVTIAMYCLIQFYVQIRFDIKEHKPMLKLLCIKLVIFFSFWQNLVIGFIATRVPATQKLAFNDVKVGIPATLLCLEMAIFATMHLWAFPWQEYSIKRAGFIDGPQRGNNQGEMRYHGGPFGVKAYWDAVNVWDVVKALARGVRWLFVGVRHRREDSSYNRAGATEYAPPDYAPPEYDSTKLGPIKPTGPSSLGRDQEMKSDSLERERYGRSGLRPPQAAAGYSAASADAPYNENRAYYTHDLVPERTPSNQDPFRDTSPYPPSSNSRLPLHDGEGPFGDQATLLTRDGYPEDYRQQDYGQHQQRYH